MSVSQSERLILFDTGEQRGRFLDTGAGAQAAPGAFFFQGLAGRIGERRLGRLEDAPGVELRLAVTDQEDAGFARHGRAEGSRARPRALAGFEVVRAAALEIEE